MTDMPALFTDHPAIAEHVLATFFYRNNNTILTTQDRHHQTSSSITSTTHKQLLAWFPPHRQPKVFSPYGSRQRLELYWKPLIFVQIHPQAEESLIAEFFQRHERPPADGPRLKRQVAPRVAGQG